MDWRDYQAICVQLRLKGIDELLYDYMSEKLPETAERKELVHFIHVTTQIDTDDVNKNIQTALRSLVAAGKCTHIGYGKWKALT